MTSGKKCCSSHYTKCPALKKKNSNGLKAAHKSGILTAKHLHTSNRCGWARGKTFVSDSRIQSTYTIDEIFSINRKISRSKVRNLVRKLHLLEYKCAKCSLTDVWQGLTLKLHLDHINGIRYDHRLENLRWLCPNCHSQTDTYCRNPGIKVSDNQLLDAMKTSTSIRAALSKLGLSDGSNYKRAKKLLQQ